MNTLQRCFSGSKRIRHFLLLTLLFTLWLSSCQKELVPLQGSGLTVEEARRLYEQDPSYSALGVRDGVEDPDAPVYEIDWEHARSYRSQGKGVDVVEAVIIQGPGSIPVYNSGASFDTTAHLRYQTQRRLVVIKNDQSRTSMFVLKISPDAASLTGISARISGTDLDHYHPDFEGILQFSSLKDTIYRTFLVRQGADITIGPPGLSSHATGGQGIEIRDIDCFPLIIPVGCPCCGHFPGESCRCSTQPYYESVIWCLSTFGGETGSGTGYDDYVPPGDTGTGTTGGGGGTPYHELSAFSKKQLKGYLQAIKVKYHFTLSLDELIRLSSGCYTVDPDTDEVTFDEGCALNALAQEYLNIIHYSGNHAVAVARLTSVPDDLSTMYNHLLANIADPGILAYHDSATDLLDNDEGYVAKRLTEFYDLLENDPHALLRPCAEQNTGYPYTFWSNLANFTPDESTMEALRQRGLGYQPLSAGNAAATSIDYYYIEIEQMPDFDGDGQPDSDQQVIDAIRGNFAALASGEKIGFEFSCPLPPWHNNPDNIWWEFKPYTPEIDNVQWQFPAPLYKNTVFFIDAGAEDPDNNKFADKGAIIISQATNCCWVGSTINTPLSGSQPFSGNRQWGLTTLPNGKKAFYTKAADRALTQYWLPTIAGIVFEGCDADTYYKIAHETWMNHMIGTGTFITQYGGRVVSEPGYTKPAINVAKTRINSIEIKEKLKGNSTLIISCD